MKKALLLFLALALVISFASCTGGNNSQSGGGGGGAEEEEIVATLTIGASSSPHAEILEFLIPIMAQSGIGLEVIEFSDYVQPNVAVEDGSLDANFFQHQPYLDEFNAENGTHIVSVCSVHYEPMCLYPGKDKGITLDSLPDGAQIALPNDTTNEARALAVLEVNGLIKLKEGIGLNATIQDIAENPKNFEFIEAEAATLPLALPDVDAAVINGNFALQGGLSATDDSIAFESSESEAAQKYANILCVKEGNEENEAVLALIQALRSDDCKEFIKEKYKGSVVPMF
ncbi:MAG: MetQ/NlpA family ABC transporter substrate-binding protein [Eubacteriaceae bacterium]|nr:MetQ/NlpA family ABC transporter substrate-binding protein [Eubacteriaceae bacterium]